MSHCFIHSSEVIKGEQYYNGGRSENCGTCSRANNKVFRLSMSCSKSCKELWRIRTKGPLPKRFGCTNYELGHVILLGVAFFLLFAAFTSAQNLQSTVNAEWGYWALAVLYVVFAVSNAFAPLLVLKLGERLSLFFAGLGYVFFIAANIQVIVPVLFVAAIVCGFGGGLLWNAQSAFMIHISSPSKTGFNSGIFFAFMQGSGVVGSLLCGILINFASVNNLILFVVFTVVATLGVSIFLFLRNPPHKPEHILKEECDRNKPLSYRLFRSFTMFRDRKFLLLISFTLTSGFSQAFFFGSFPSLFGRNWIGWVMVFFYVADASGSMIVGRLIKILTVKFVFLMGGSFLTLGGLILVIVPPNDLKTFMGSFCAIAFIFGLTDASWNTLFYEVWGNYWTKKIEIAFGAMRLVQGIGFAIALFIQPVLSISVTASILLSLFAVTIVCFLICDHIQSMDIKVDELSLLQQTELANGTSNSGKHHEEKLNGNPSFDNKTNGVTQNEESLSTLNKQQSNNIRTPNCIDKKKGNLPVVEEAAAVFL